MNWKEIYKRNALKNVEIHKRNGYDFLSKEKYNEMALELLEPLAINETSCVLDAGCGCGSFSKVISKLGVTNLTGIDYIEESVNVAKQELPSFNFFCNSVDRMSDIKSDSYDIVTCNGVFIYLTHAEAERALREIHRVLKVGGEAYIGGINHVDKVDLYNELRKTTHANNQPKHLFLKEDFFEVEGLEVTKVLHYSDTKFAPHVCVSPYRFAVYVKKVL